MGYFEDITYWRGPVWINTNWMIYRGLLKYGYRNKAKELRDSMLSLVREKGVRE